jgi:LacI family transcriptional regulator
VDNNNISRIRIKDIARLSGFSTGTVDRVLHDRGEVSEETRKKILEIIKEMDYQPDILASNLAARKPCRVAALIPAGTEESPFWEYPRTGIEEGLMEIAHFGISVSNHFFDYYDRNSFLEKSKEMLEEEPQGVILAPVFSREASGLIKELNDKNIPVVLINASICNGSCIAFIGQDSFQSGMVSGRLMYYGLQDDADILIVNFIRETGRQEHIIKREEGFRKFYSNYSSYGDSRLHQINIPETGVSKIGDLLEGAILQSGDVKGIFVTNSRVFQVARLLEQIKKMNIILIGYDLLEENKDFLRKGTIDFLISQKPSEQGYKSIMTLYHHLVLKKEVQNSQYLPVDIITSENLEHYTFT